MGRTCRCRCLADRTTWEWNDSSWTSREDGWWNASGGPTSNKVGRGDFSDPPEWPGWQHYRVWKKAVTRWARQTDVSEARRADKILKLLGWDVNKKFEHIPDHVLQSDKGVERVFNVLDSLSGQREGDDLRRAVREAFFEHMRRKDETLTQFVARREQQYLTLEDHRMQLPPEVKGILLEEGASLTVQGEQNLRSLSGGKVTLQEVAQALRNMDTQRNERVTNTTGRSANYIMEDDNLTTPTLSLMGETSESYELDSLCSADEDEILAEIESMDIPEHEIIQTFAVLEKQRRKTWAENKMLKQSVKRDRQLLTRREFQQRDGKESTGTPSKSFSLRMGSSCAEVNDFPSTRSGRSAVAPSARRRDTGIASARRRPLAPKRRVIVRLPRAKAILSMGLSFPARFRNFSSPWKWC